MFSTLGTSFAVLFLCVALLVAACAPAPDNDLGENISNVFEEFEIGDG